jgi:hypothetical protein
MVINGLVNANWYYCFVWVELFPEQHGFSVDTFYDWNIAWNLFVDGRAYIVRKKKKKLKLKNKYDIVPINVYPYTRWQSCVCVCVKGREFNSATTEESKCRGWQFFHSDLPMDLSTV